MQQLRYSLDNPASKTARKSTCLSVRPNVQTDAGAQTASNLMGTMGCRAEGKPARA